MVSRGRHGKEKSRPKWVPCGMGERCCLHWGYGPPGSGGFQLDSRDPHQLELVCTQYNDEPEEALPWSKNMCQVGSQPKVAIEMGKSFRSASYVLGCSRRSEPWDGQ